MACDLNIISSELSMLVFMHILGSFHDLVLCIITGLQKMALNYCSRNME